MTAHFAIVGSGPSGMYAADALLEGVPDARVDVYDRMPAPFGLIRYGVAPDHYKTKNTARQFARTLESGQVRFFGNVEVGRDVSLDELKANYDAVVLAIGAYNDRALGIPGENLTGVYGACAFVGWYNGHPDYRDLDPLLDRDTVCVVGVGNVALDVCRVLAKTADEMTDSDIAKHALDAIQKAPLKNLYMFGRRGPIEAGFTPKELGEIRELERCAAVIDAHQLPDKVEGEFEGREKGVKEKNLAIFKEIATRAKPAKPLTMKIEFYAAPKEILGTDRVEGLRLERTKVENGRAVGTGEIWDVPCGTVIRAIGYFSKAPDGVPMDKGGTITNADGRVADNLWVVGWSKRGPSGTIPTNGPESREVMEKVIAAHQPGNKAGGEAIAKLLKERGARVVDYPAFKKISAAEAARARPGSPQEKFTRIDEMLALLS
jgi:ferredoxin--NADP+ reductase